MIYGGVVGRKKRWRMREEGKEVDHEEEKKGEFHCFFVSNSQVCTDV